MVVVTDARPGFAQQVLEALGLEPCEASVVALRGAAVRGAYGEAMGSILAAVARMGATDVLVVGPDTFVARSADQEGGESSVPDVGGGVAAGLAALGLSPAYLERALRNDPALEPLLAADPSCEAAVRRTVFLVRNHPLMPRSVRVWGLALNPATGRVRVIS